MYGFLLECLPLCHLSLLFMMTNSVLGCCKSKVQLQHILQTWLGHVKQSFTIPKICSGSGFAMKHVKTELETSAAWSSCPFAGLPPSKRAAVCIPWSITSCCCISSWLERNPVAASSNTSIQSAQLHDDSAVLHCELVPALRNSFSVSFSTLFEN